MHGAAPGEDDRHCLRRHMWPAPPPPVAVSPDRSYLQPTAPDCFLKGGRKIQVGDCALFQAGNAPPFIGIIRWFVTSKEDFLKLCVNWLYRPADVKLAKGILVEAAPNEIFYSFHKDVISAASLLHPCKVAFLGKGIDLPSGISSFICRRVYDIESKCLWSLTDKDYINERQEEVDQLLDKTRLEMHATVQSGGRSPKSLNGPASQQLKSGSDVQNIGTSLPSLVKGKKRDRGDQVNEPIKRERSAKTEDDDSITSRLDSMIKAEITKITDKGGLTNSEGVDKLLHLMQFVRAERKLNLTGRVLLADVISATDRNDCLSRFVQLRGVAVLDDWLQEVRKGKTGDGSSPKESDKASEEFLLALLRALDKLPVSLNALQTCNIGKSVNNLRSHKNLEIQKKARGLVDTWKKRVDAEIKSNDAKSVGSSQAVSWPGKPGFSEVPQALNRRTSSTDVSLKSSIAQPSTCSRALPGKPDHADAIVKSAPVISGPLKMPSSSLPASMVGSKDSLLKGAGSSANLEVPQTAAKEEKSSSSSQSQNNSQSCSSDHAKTMGSSWKEDARSSSAGSINASKTSGGSSRHRRSNNGCPGASISVVQKEANLGKSGSPVRSTALDKVPQGSLTSEKPLDMPVSDRGSNHKLIVRIPNPGRNSMQSTGGGSLEDPSVIRSKGSSPSTLDNHENSDPRANMKGDQSHMATGVRTEAQQSNKEELAGLEERDRPPGATLDEGEGHKNADGIDKSTDVSRATFSSPGNVEGGCKTEQKPRNSFSPMNALIESCVKYSEASVSLSNGDDIGMNLLASVATGEMTKPDINSPKECPGTSPAIEEPRAGDSKAKSILSCDNGIAQSHGQCDETADVDSEKHDKCAGYAIAKDETQGEGTDFSADKKIITPVHENKSIVEQTGQQLISSINLHKVTDSSINSEGSVFSVCIPADVDEIECDGALRHHDKRKNCNQVSDPSDDKFKFRNSSTDGNKSVDCSTVCENIAESGTSASGFFCNSLDDGCQNDITLSSGKSEVAYCLSFNNEIPCGPTSIKQQLTPVSENDAENVDKKGDAGTSSCADESLCPDSADSKSRNSDCSRAGQSEHIDIERKEPSNCAPIIVEQVGSIINPLGTTGGVEEVVETKEVPQQPPVSSKCESAPTFQDQEVERCTKPTGSKLSGADAAGRDELASSAEASSLVVDAATKLDFDLNEGITGDDENQSEPGTSAVLVCSSAVYLPCVSSFSCTPTSNGSPALVTMAAPAKGPFLPPENLSRKPELGWKGSAATSAFRPAEPRKILEMPLTTFEVPSSAAAKKHGRPLLDIDLNVADERALEDMASPSSGQTTGSESGAISNRNAPMRSSVGFDLDLNRVDKDAENGPFIANAIRRSDPSVLPVRLASGGLPTGDTNMFRDFDLNNGPGLEVGLESLPRRHHAKSNTSVPFLPPAAGLRMNNPELGNLSPWFPPSNSYPAVAIPSFLPDRGEQNYPIVAAAGSQRIVGSLNGGANFGGDFYRGPVLSSSPAMAFAPATTFPYAGFTFGSSFPVASTSFSGVPTTYVDSSSGGGSSFPAVPSQLIGPGGAVSSQYPRPYVFGLPEASTSGGSDSSRKWARHGLDLNAGPGNAEAEVKDDIFSPASRQLSIASAQAFVEEQARSYQAAGSGLKRKEPEGGCDADRFVGYKQHPWQYADK